MTSTADTPIYNLKAVVQETGLKPDTLRAWERRYGLPAPRRTESGHRLYSQSDIDLLKWLMARQEDGMSISRAAELWRQLEAESKDPLQAMPVAPTLTTVSRMAGYGNAAATFGSNGDDTLSQLRDGWITSCLNFDEQSADEIITQAFALFPAEKVCLEVLQKGLGVIGEQWYLGNITVQQEHFASSLALRRVEALLAATPPPTRPGRILIGCPPDEAHTFVPLMLTLLLRRRSWNVIFLGANVPIQDFVLTVQTAKPQLVVLTAQLLFTAAGVRELGELIYEVNVPMGYGGLIFTQLPKLRQHITGHYLGDSVEKAIDEIEKMMLSPKLPTPVAPLSPKHEDALAQFRRKQSQVEMELWHAADRTELSHTLLRKANINFGRDILAALALGDIHHLGVDLPWVRGLLKNHYQLPESAIDNYLQLYLAAAEKVLNGSCPILMNWLREIVKATKNIPVAAYLD
ncbi:MAG TPA: MerR family transcriptional regulator [Caldilineaceae bacterium]|nr:MerR family transcriptional regulator [Caldilineaceae bacterium]